MSLRTTDRFARAWKRRIWIRALRRFHPEAKVNLPYARVSVDVRDEIVGTSLYLEREYESEVHRLMSACELGGSVCVDVGAHIGLHTIFLSKLAGSDGKVFAIEPQSRNFALLQANLRSNATTNVQAMNAAAGNRDGSCRMRVHPTNHGDHRVSSGADGTETVRMLSLDSVLKDVPSGAVRFIKMDVQGYETYVVRGMHETLSRNPECVLFIEVFPEGLLAAGSSASELVASLRDLGLDGWEFHDFRVIPCQEPAVYDLIQGGKYANLVLSRNGDRITGVLERLLGVKLPTSRPVPAIA